MSESSLKFVCLGFVFMYDQILEEGNNGLHLWLGALNQHHFLPFMIERRAKCLIGTIFKTSESLLLANFDKALTWMLSRHGIYDSLNSSKLGRESMTNLRYATIPLFLAIKLPLT